MADETAMDKDSSFETKENESEDSPIHTTGKEQTLDASENERNAPPSDRDWKVEILLKQSGNAPILQKKKWSVPATFKIADVMKFIRQYMKLDSATSLLLYVNQAFAPSPDDIIGNIHRCFNTNGKLVLHYSTTTAWG